jgi:hypothetical protein
VVFQQQRRNPHRSTRQESLQLQRVHRRLSQIVMIGDGVCVLLVVGDVLDPRNPRLQFFWSVQVLCVDSDYVKLSASGVHVGPV